MTCPPCTHDCREGRNCPARSKSQEPVAWGVFEGNLHDMFFSQEEAQEMADLKGTPAEVRPLYTTPPQRTWVGLTDEEVELYWDWEDFQCGCGPSTLFAMVRDIEARLKDRNI